VSQLLITFQISTTFAGDLMTAIGPIMGKITDIEFEMVTVREPVPVAKTVRNTNPKPPEQQAHGQFMALDCLKKCAIACAEDSSDENFEALVDAAFTYGRLMVPLEEQRND
jgi:hypothetical protein